MDDVVRLNSRLTGRYDLEREIGRGGMATVYLARDVQHGRNVALKVLNPEIGAVLGVERFLAEIQVTRACSIRICCRCSIPAKQMVCSSM